MQIELNRVNFICCCCARFKFARFKYCRLGQMLMTALAGLLSTAWLLCSRHHSSQRRRLLMTLNPTDRVSVPYAAICFSRCCSHCWKNNYYVHSVARENMSLPVVKGYIAESLFVLDWWFLFNAQSTRQPARSRPDSKTTIKKSIMRGEPGRREDVTNSGCNGWCRKFNRYNRCIRIWWAPYSMEQTGRLEVFLIIAWNQYIGAGLPERVPFGAGTEHCTFATVDCRGALNFLFVTNCFASGSP